MKSSVSFITTWVGVADPSRKPNMPEGKENKKGVGVGR